MPLLQPLWEPAVEQHKNTKVRDHEFCCHSFLWDLARTQQPSSQPQILNRVIPASWWSHAFCRQADSWSHVSGCRVGSIRQAASQVASTSTRHRKCKQQCICRCLPTKYFKTLSLQHWSIDFEALSETPEC